MKRIERYMKVLHYQQEKMKEKKRESLSEKKEELKEKLALFDFSLKGLFEY